MIVGIDYSLTAPAVAVLDSNGTLIATKHWAKQPNHSSHLQRIIWLADEISTFITKFNPSTLLIEDYAFTANGRITSIAEGCGLLKCSLQASCGLEPSPVSISSWKKTLTGNGRADKPLITQVVNEKFGLQLTGKKGEQDIADAIGVSFWGFVQANQPS